jgi:hypothetical protein
VSYFKKISADEDPEDLLRPENQVSTPWGSPDCGPCDECDQGNCKHRCLSCIEGGANPDCPACGGKVRWIDVCPACEGSGEIDRVERRGVSVFPTLPGLYRYLVERDEDLDGDRIVEMEGELSGDRDLDADDGALLVRPTRIAGKHEVDDALLREVRSRAQA